jgi:hypothetical protein
MGSVRLLIRVNIENTEKMTESVTTAAADVAARIDALVLDPRLLVHAALARAAALQYPSAERQNKAAALIRELLVRIMDSLITWDVAAVRRALNDFEREVFLLSLPIRTPSFAENLATRIAEMNARGWLSAEAEALKMYAQPTDSIISFDERSATLASGRTVTREQIRNDLRPRWQLPEHWKATWDYGAMARAEAESIAKAAAARAAEARALQPSSGPAHMLGPRIA